MKHGLISLAVSVLLLLALCPLTAGAQPAKSSPLPALFEELTSSEFADAVGESKGVCVVPLGILEKHGPHLPLGTDLLNAREVALRAVRNEYAVVFPEYYFGQIYEAKHQPGTIAYSPELVWKLLQETCDELARNGFTKIVLVNGHGGNRYFLSYFCQAQLATRRAYSVVLFSPGPDTALERRVAALRKTSGGGHADELETSELLSHRPELVHSDHAKEESGENLNRLGAVPFAFTGIWWYARYPNHYAGDGSASSKELGNLLLESESKQLAQLLKALKDDAKIQELQEEFYEKAERSGEIK